jgi:deoxyribonuclease-4
MWLGAHIGIADGLDQAVLEGKKIGCDSIQIFSKSPQMWAGPPIPEDAAVRFREAVKAHGLRATAVHHGYLLNLANPKAGLLKRSRQTFIDELHRADLLGVDALIIHSGAHLGTGVEEGLTRIAESLTWALEQEPELRTTILLENAAGQGSALGSNFAELRTILDKVQPSGRVHVAIDTCHLFASGIDFRGPEAYGAMVDRLDRELGIAEVRAFHLNDAKAELGSHLDRHENIGIGQIGPTGFAPLVNDGRWGNVPGYLETPLDADDYAKYKKDLETLRGLLAGASKSTRERSAKVLGRRASPKAK